MKEKIKKFSKKYLIGFMLGLISGSLVMVYAQTYFPSNQTTYDNSNTDMSSTNVQGAIDELYNVCFPPKTGGEWVLDNTDIVTSGEGLYKDAYEDGRYFYKGKNVKNYVTFNNEIAGWRIISVEADGTVKIMRDTSIVDEQWDSYSGITNWDRPAPLNTYLNSTYYNSLNSIAQNQIVSKDFSIGELNRNNNLSNSINSENSKKWNGKVALVTASEYVRSNSNQGSCGNINQLWNSSSCGNTTWMHNSTRWWTLSHVSDDSNFVIMVDSNSGLYSDRTYYSYGVRPVVYLSAEVQITGGDGSKSNPYTIS